MSNKHALTKGLQIAPSGGEIPYNTQIFIEPFRFFAKNL